MKKIITLALALTGFAGAANAATVDDLQVLKHSYVLVCDEITGTSDAGAGAKPGKGMLFGADHFLDLTGGTTANNKGKVDLSVVDPAEDAEGNPLPQYVTQDIVDKYGASYFGPHYNCFRLKNKQDVIALKLTANSKLIIFLQGNNKTGKEARIPCIAKTADLSDPLNPAPDADHPTTVSGFRWDFTVSDDGLYYIGSYNGDMFVSFIIVEANEAPGTPTVKVGDQTFADGLWFREVTCKANDATEEGSEEKIPTIVTYTTDGSTPTAASPVYTAPIKCYTDQTVKFQAYLNLGDGKADEDLICDGADNEANVSFNFDAPTIEADGANVTIVSPYNGAKNYYSLNGGEAQEGSSFVLEESATISAYSEIINGDKGKFTTKSTSQDVYVLNPIKETKTITVTAGELELDAEATEQSTTGPVYKVVGGEISADSKDFFVKNLTFKAIASDGDDAQYQVPEGQEIYIQMSNTNITFQVAEGDSVNVKVICSNNACKNINADDAEDGSQVTDRKCYVNISGTNYFHKDAEGNEASDVKLYPDEANVIEFGLKGAEGGSFFTFQKYSGTGNILISSIEITPVAQGEQAKPGDANLDGKIDVRDMAKILEAILNGATDTLPASADMNGDGKIDVRDMAIVLDLILGNANE